MLDTRVAIALWLTVSLGFGACSLFAASYRPMSNSRAGSEVFSQTSGVRHLEIEISKEGMDALRKFSFRSREEDRRTNVAATVREGNQVWTNVSVHVKGALGSFRSIDSKPSLTLNFDKWVRGQTFHGLEKISLNNSVQDSSYLNEKICRELYNAAGVPAPRADFASVALNGRRLGLFVLTEGWNKQFLRGHFPDVSGALFEPGLSRDVTGTWATNVGAASRSLAALKAVGEATRVTDHAERLERLRESIDLDGFITMTALDCLMWNWDGYAMNRNNYRMFHDAASERIVFLPHGVDQMFWKPNGPIMTGRSGAVAKSLLETEEGRDLFLKRVRELRRTVFDVKTITNRIAQETERLRLVVARDGVAAVAAHQSAVQLWRNRVVARVRDIDQQLDGVTNLMRLKENESIALTNWVARRQFGSLVLDQTAQPEGLRIAVNGETSFGAWVTTVWIEEGRYVLEGRVKTRGVQGSLRNEKGGAGFRVWSTRKETRGASWGWFPFNSSRDLQLGGLIPVITNSVEMRLTGTTDWTTLTHEFELRHPLADLQIQCVLQSSAGEAWFDQNSIRLRRLSMNASRGGKD